MDTTPLPLNQRVQRYAKARALGWKCKESSQGLWRMDYNRHMRIRLMKLVLPGAILSVGCCGLLLGQPAAGPGPGARGPGRGPARPVLSVTSSSFPDGGEVPLKYSFYGENKSPEFTFTWTLG